MKKVCLYNGSAWLSCFELDEPIDEVNNETFEYICYQAISKGINFLYQNDEPDEIYSDVYTYVDLSAYGLDNIYVYIYDFSIE